MISTANVLQVLLLTNAEVSRELGVILWAALLEIEQFYNNGRKRAEFQRLYISPYVPSVGVIGTIGSALRGLLPLHGGASEDALGRLGQAERRQTQLPGIAEIQGLYKKTYDYEKLVKLVREVIQEQGSGSSKLLIVTDCELTPPKDWPYIIWDYEPADGGGAVVSVAPIDPKYWRDPDPNRLSTIKHRVRTAGLSVTGEMLGLRLCNNPGCFLYKNVDSATTLDFMTQLGPEHEEGTLTGSGYAIDARDLTSVQKIVKDPAPRNWGAA
jgi:predicted Zn-dependent protease